VYCFAGWRPGVDVRMRQEGRICDRAMQGIKNPVVKRQIYLDRGGIRGRENRKGDPVVL
jgi:hypothetical protein